MTSEERDTTVAQLRSIADFYESIDENKLEVFPAVYLSKYWFSENVSISEYKDGEYQPDKEKSLKRIAAIARAIPGKKEKNYDGDEFAINVELAGGLELSWYVDRTVTCKKVPTGKVRTIPAYSSPERVEPEYEWVCDEVILLNKQ